MATFGERFRATLHSRGLTQAAAAKLLDTTQSVVSYYSNLSRPPRRGTLLNIAERLGVAVEHLTGDRGVGQRGKVTVASSEARSQQLFNDAMQNLKRRWKKKPEERDAIRHLVPLIFPDEADRILNWLDQV